MKKLLFAFLLVLASCANEAPTAFSEKALNDKIITLDKAEITVSDVLEKYKGQKIVIDVWASWCGDCIKGLPKVVALQEKFKDVTYVFISIDETPEDWKNGIKKYNITGEHYLLPSKRDGDFGTFINMDWIPRYIVVNPEGEISLFKAVEADDKNIIAALKS